MKPTSNHIKKHENRVHNNSTRTKSISTNRQKDRSITPIKSALKKGSNQREIRTVSYAEDDGMDESIDEYTRVIGMKDKRGRVRQDAHKVTKENLLESLFFLVRVRQYFRKWQKFAHEQSDILITETSNYLHYKSISMGVKLLLRAKKNYITKKLRRSLRRWFIVCRIGTKRLQFRGQSLPEDAFDLVKYDVLFVNRQLPSHKDINNPTKQRESFSLKTPQLFGNDFVGYGKPSSQMNELSLQKQSTRLSSMLSSTISKELDDEIRDLYDLLKENKSENVLQKLKRSITDMNIMLLDMCVQRVSTSNNIVIPD